MGIEDMNFSHSKWALIGALLLLSNLAYALDPSLSTFVQIGNRTTEEAIEGIKTQDYDYAKYYLKCQCPIGKPSGLALVYSTYLKKYEDRKDLDNATFSIKSYLDYPLAIDEDSSLKFDFNLGWREKRYKNKEIYTNSQFMSKLKSTYEIEDLWGISGELGYKTYDYFQTEGRNRMEFSERVEGRRYFYEGRLQFFTVFNFRQTSFDSNSDTNQFIYRLGTAVRPGVRFLSGITGRIEEGKRYSDEDSAEIGEEEEGEEGQEGDYYFKYRKWWIKTEYPLRERLDTTLKYTSYNKDYTTTNYDFRWYEIESRWTYIILRNPLKRLTLNLGYLHREMDYPQWQSSSYDKDSLETGARFSLKNDWSVLFKSGLSIQNYIIGKERDKDVYSAGIEFEKDIIVRRLSFVLGYERKLKNYKLRQDETQETGKILIDYKF